MGNLSNESKAAIRALVTGFNFDTILSNSIVSTHKTALLGNTTDPGTEVNAFIDMETSGNLVALKADLTSRITVLIPDAMLTDISSVLTLKTNKEALENEIAELKASKSNVRGSDIERESQLFAIETTIEAKEAELKTCRASYVTAYEAALSSSVISEELYDISNLVKIIYNEKLSEIEDAFNLAKARLEVLRRMKNRLQLIDDLNNIVDQRLSINNISNEAIRSASSQVPLIKSILK